jgi:uncharacterized membrane protein YfcA
LLIIAKIVAPIGVWLLQFVPTNMIWWIYVAVLFFLAYRMAFPPKMDDSHAPVITDDTRVKAGAATGGIGIFAGFLGVGPGFLLMPTLVLIGYTARIAAATNSVIVTLPSFSAFAWLGARFMAKRVKSLTLSRIFAVALVLLAVQRAYLLIVS